MGSSGSKELLSKVELDSKKPVSVDVARRIFSLFDTDRSGVLSASESVKFISAYLVAHGEANASAERALSLLNAIDRNGDGCVSFEELTGMPRTLGLRHWSATRLGESACGAFDGVALLAKIEIVQWLEHDWRYQRRHHKSRAQHPVFTLRLVCREFRALADNLVVDALITPPFTLLDVSSIARHNFCRTALPLTVQEVARCCNTEPWFAAVDSYATEMARRKLDGIHLSYNDSVVFFTDAPVVGDLEISWSFGNSSSSRCPLNVRDENDVFRVDLKILGAASPAMHQLLTKSTGMRTYSNAFTPHVSDLQFDVKTTITVLYKGAKVGHVTFQPVALGAIRSELHGDKNTLTVLFTELEQEEKIVPEFMRARCALLVNEFEYRLY